LHHFLWENFFPVFEGDTNTPLVGEYWYLFSLRYLSTDIDIVTGSGEMNKKKINLEAVSSLITALISRIGNALKCQILSLTLLVMAIILEYLRGLLTVLIPRMEDATKRQMHSLVSLVAAVMFFTGPFMPIVGASSSYTIVKNVTSINGDETLRNVAKAGDVISYNITVSNNDPNSNLTNVSVVDPLLNLTTSGETIIPPGGNYSIVNNYTVTQEDLNSNGNGTGFINNTVFVTSDEWSNNTSNKTPIILNPSYEVDKNVISINGNESLHNVIKAGDIISYQIIVNNTGNIDLTSVNVTDPLISLVNLTSVISPGNNLTLINNYTVTQEDLNSNGNGTGFINNTAFVTSNLGQKNDTVLTSIIRNPSYKVDKIITNINGNESLQNVTKAGDVISYQIIVNNTGNVDLANVKVTDPLTSLGFSVPFISPGNNATLTGNYTVTQADLNSNGNGTGIITNTVFVTSDQEPKNDTVSTSIIRNPSYEIDKIITGVNGNVALQNVTKAGDVISYQILVNNTGNVDLTNVNVTDPLLNFGLSTPVIDPGNYVIFTGNYTVTQADITSNGSGTGFINNTAFVTSDLGPKNDTVSSQILRTSYTVDKNIISINGNESLQNVTKAGDVINYKITVNNTGNVDLTNVTANDTLIDLEEYIESISNNTVLNIGENWVYTGNYTVTQEEINNNGGGDGFVNNTVIADCNELDPQNDSAQAHIIQNPSYEVDKVVTSVNGNETLRNVTRVGDVISYQIILNNTGNMDFTNVTVNDTLIGLTGPVESNSNNSVLNVGESWIYTGNYTVTRADMNDNGGGDGVIDNVVTVNCDHHGSKSHGCGTPIGHNPDYPDYNPDYSIYKSVIGPDGDGDCIVNSPGDKIPYRIVVTNTGNVDLTGVSVEDTMLYLTGPIGDDEDPGVLNPGEVWVYTGVYTLKLDDIINGNGKIDNIATVSCNELPDESSSVSQPIEEKSDLSISKSIIGLDDTGDFIINEPGDVINYQIVVENNGDEDLTDVSVEDSMIDLKGPIGDYHDAGVLNPDELWVFTGDYTVTPEDIYSNGNGDGFIENTATVHCNELPEESSSYDVPIINTPAIIVTPENGNSNLPVVNLGANPTSGYAPLTVQFTDLSENAESRSWDFTNDGTWDSSEANPVYTYTAPGTYIVNLASSNPNGTISKNTPITVLEATSSGGGGSSHSSHSSGISSPSVVSKGGTTSTGTGTLIQPKNDSKDLKQDNVTPAPVAEPTPQTKNETNTSAKQNKKSPGFEMVMGIIGLLGVFLYRRR
jgi:trimeric autotransporter adhesin